MDTCLVFVMITNLMIWVSVALLIIGVVSNIFGLLLAGINFLVICMLIYYCFVCNSEIAQYVKNPIPASEIYQYVEDLFKKAPSLQMNMECYHTYRSGKHTRRRVTHVAQEQIPYYTWKDISGEFSLDKTQATAIMLSIDADVNYFEDGTEQDIEQVVARFKVLNTRDIYQNYEEKITVENMKPQVLVMLSDSYSCWLSEATYWLFSIFALYFVYHCIFHCLCSDQRYTIKKLISTKTDLRQNNMLPNYEVARITRMGSSVIYAEGGLSPPLPPAAPMMVYPQDASNVQNVQINPQ